MADGWHEQREEWKRMGPLPATQEPCAMADRFCSLETVGEAGPFPEVSTTSGITD